MSEKTKKIIRRVAWGLVAVGVATLIVLGVTQEEITAGVVLIDAAVVAVGAAAAYIIGKAK